MAGSNRYTQQLFIHITIGKKTYVYSMYTQHVTTATFTQFKTLYSNRIISYLIQVQIGKCVSCVRSVLFCNYKKTTGTHQRIITHTHTVRYEQTHLQYTRFTHIHSTFKYKLRHTQAHIYMSLLTHAITDSVEETQLDFHQDEFKYSQSYISSGSKGTHRI